MINLHYASLMQAGLDLDIEKESFQAFEIFHNRLIQLLNDTEEAGLSPIYLFTCSWDWTANHADLTRVHVSDNADDVSSYASYHTNIHQTMQGRKKRRGLDLDIHIQEYETYEDAYNVALNMMEGHQSCYNK